MITIKKSQYVTQVYINGMDMGTSMACYTPIEFPVNKAIKFGAENEILIRVGERIWLPAEAQVEQIRRRSIISLESGMMYCFHSQGISELTGYLFFLQWKTKS